MALPTSASTTFARTRTGVMLGVYPSTKPGFSVRLRRSTHGTTSSTNWFTTVLDASTASRNVIVELPLSTRTFYWQAQHFAVGFSDGAWSAKVAAKPTKLGTLLEVPGIQRTKGGTLESPLNINVPSTGTVTVGAPSQANPTTYIVKTIRIPHTELVPRGTSEQAAFGTVYVTPVSTGGGAVSVVLRGAVVIPKGVTITKFSARLFRMNAGDGASATLFGIASDASTTLAIANHGGSTGWLTVATTMSKLVGDESYATEVVVVNALGGLTGDARFQFAELEYRMPTYAKTY